MAMKAGLSSASMPAAMHEHTGSRDVISNHPDGCAPSFDTAPASSGEPASAHCGAELARACPNCGTPVSGAWCSGCGQESPAGPGTFERTVRRQWARIRHSLITLVLHPGRLTVEFRDGQRARSISPWRLALNVAALFLAFSFVTDFRIASIAAQDRSGTLQGMTDAAARRAHIDRLTMTERLDHRFNATYSMLMIVSVACYALLARLLHFRAKESWTVHFVFALHLTAWIFIANLFYYLAARALGLPAAISVDETIRPASVALFALIVSWQLVYIAMAFRRVYADRWPGAGARAAIFVFVALIVDNAVLFLSFWLTVETALRAT